MIRTVKTPGMPKRKSKYLINYGRYLAKLIKNEWEILLLNDKIKSKEQEFGDALGLIMLNEFQKIQLEELNNKLVEAAQIHDRDMKMAQNVQRSLFVQEAPKTNNYDIAFYYKPYSLVSGDFYDYYVNEDKNLYGLVLSDVSGHGIASSLLTVLAKPVFFRSFNKHFDKDLGEIVKKINKQLVAQMCNVENYLTSIILKIYDSKIEYVNAAHPDIILKSFEKGTCGNINSDEFDSRGSLLGISATMSNYQSYVFDVCKDDILLLYTDCFSEARNSEMQEFAENNNIINILDRSKREDSAEKILNDILQEFRQFTGEHKLNDDLTVIVLKKK